MASQQPAASGTGNSRRAKLGATPCQERCRVLATKHLAELTWRACGYRTGV